MKSELKDIQSERIKGAILRSKIQWAEEGEQSTKFFYDLEKYNAVKKQVRKLKLDDGQVITEQNKIEEQLYSFYKSLYTSKPTKTNIESYVTEQLPKLSESEKHVCDRSITIAECKEALNTFKNSKSPGNDGLNKEFYERFWTVISEPLIRSYNAAFEQGELTTSQRQAVIMLMAKEGKDREKLSNWRPISLLNLDYKILSKTLSIRIKEYLPKLIHPSQAGFVGGRGIGDANRIIQDVMTITDQRNENGILLCVDFEKAFDSVEMNFIKVALDKFNLGDNFSKWISILYNNISSCVINNGTSSKYFDVTRGVRQGDPLSPYLFLFAIEVVAAKIRNDANIKGIKINNSELKLSMYADDMTLVVKDVKSAKHAFALLKTFEHHSGLRLNVDKTEGMWLGGQKHSTNTPFGISWPKTPIKILGIFHSYNPDDTIAYNFENKIDKLIKQLHWWKARNLTLSGRILVVKTLGISKFALVSNVLHVPDSIIKRINTIIFNFVWKAKTDKIKRKIFVQDYKLGGYKMIDYNSYVKAAKCTWITRYLDGQTFDWKSSFEGFCKKENLALFLRSNFDMAELPNTMPLYYKDSITAWSCLHKKANKSTFSFLWYNKCIKINNRTVYSKNLFQLGIWSRGDLYEDDKLIPFEFWRTKGANTLDYMVWRGLVHITLRQQGTENGVLDRGYVMVGRIMKQIDMLRQRDFRKAFDTLDYQSLVRTDFKAKCKYESMNGRLHPLDWQKIYTLPIRLRLMNFIKDLQYRILHRILGTNKLLFQIKKLDSPRCSFCKTEIESIEHLFYQCDCVKIFWDKVLHVYNAICVSQPVQLTESLIIFGYYASNVLEFECLNILIAVGKEYIWNCKVNSLKPHLPLFHCQLNRNIRIKSQEPEVNDLLVDILAMISDLYFENSVSL